MGPPRLSIPRLSLRKVDKTFLLGARTRLIVRRVDVPGSLLSAVEIFQDHTRVATMYPLSARRPISPVNEHMPKAPSRYGNKRRRAFDHDGRR